MDPDQDFMADPDPVTQEKTVWSGSGQNDPDSKHCKKDRLCNTVYMFSIYLHIFLLNVCSSLNVLYTQLYWYVYCKIITLLS